jgi:hypothetical protein
MVDEALEAWAEKQHSGSCMLGYILQAQHAKEAGDQQTFDTVKFMMDVDKNCYYNSYNMEIASAVGYIDETYFPDVAPYLLDPSQDDYLEALDAIYQAGFRYVNRKYGHFHRKPPVVAESKKALLDAIQKLA